MELCKIREALDRSVNLRTYLTKFSNRYDLDWIADVGELYIRYRMNDFNKAKEVAARAPKTYYVNQIVEAMDSSRGKDFSKEEVSKLSENSHRKKLWKYLFLSEFPATKDFSPVDSMKVALEIGERTGSRDIFIRQGNHHHNLIFQIAREEPSMFLDELSRDCLKRVKLRNQSQSESEESLTLREIQVLKHLATGKAINLIGKELHISQNTMKTHLRNIYRKLQVDGRKTAVEKGKANFII
jgi:DNA-binding CsgD family transcriptional regulator